MKDNIPKKILNRFERIGNEYAWVDRVQVDWGDGKAQKTYIAGLPDGCHVLALTKQGKIPLVHQYRVLGEHGWRYELPGGIQEETESPQVTAIRELEEETGFLASTIQELMTYTPSPVLKLRIHLYFAKNLKKTKIKRDKGEHEMEVIMVTPEQLYEMIMDGTIIDSNTIMAFFMAQEKKLIKIDKKKLPVKHP